MQRVSELTLGLGPAAGLCFCATAALAVQAYLSATRPEREPPFTTALFWLRALHWAVTTLAMLFPLVFSPALDPWFLAAWVAVMATWAACDNTCVLSHLEAARMAEPDPGMFDLPTPWPAFFVMLLVALRHAAGLASCADGVALVAGFGTYVTIHVLLVRSQAARTRPESSPPRTTRS